MSRYTDIDLFLQNIEEIYCNNCERRKGMKNGKQKFVYEIGEAPCRCCAVDEMKYEVENAPTADVVPVVHGHWIDMGDFEQCSVCKATRLKEFNAAYGEVMWIRTAYCPYCGAKLDVTDINVGNKDG